MLHRTYSNISNRSFRQIQTQNINLEDFDDDTGSSGGGNNSNENIPSLNVSDIDLNKLNQFEYHRELEEIIASFPEHSSNSLHTTSNSTDIKSRSNSTSVGGQRKNTNSSEENSELQVKTISRNSTINKYSKMILPQSNITQPKIITQIFNDEPNYSDEDDTTDENEDEFSPNEEFDLNMNPNTSATPKVSITPPTTQNKPILLGLPLNSNSSGSNGVNSIGSSNSNNSNNSNSQPNQQQQHQPPLSPNGYNNNNNNFIVIRGNQLDKSMPINFNVGGTLFATSLRTICIFPQGLLYKIVELQIDLVLKDEVIFIDRNPMYFSFILDFLRTGRYCAPIKSTSSSINTKALIQEAEFFRILPMVEQIKNEPELSRIEIIKMINQCYDYPRLRGIYLCKINFHGLDLNCATFEYSNLSECTFHSTVMTNTNLYNAKLDKVIFKNCKASNSTFTNCEITNSLFTNNSCIEMAAVNVTFENSKLTGSIFSCSNFTGSNFKNTILHGCDFTNCNLSNCDFTGASVDVNTNFSGSVMKNAIFKDCDLTVAKNLKSWKKPKSVRNRNKITIPHI